MAEGDLVVVVGKLDSRIKEVDQTKLVMGTFIGFVYASNASFDKVRQAQVLLEDGIIFTGNEYDVVRAEDQDAGQ